jgi:ABC-2 type transport system permease protein
VTPPPLHDPERESDGQFLIALLSLLLGSLGLLAAVILYFTDQPGLAAEGFPKFRIIAAIGAGLVALGLSLEYPRIVGYFQQRKSLHAVNAVLMSGLALAALVLVNVASNRYDFWRADLTSEGLYTLSDESRALVAGLDRNVRLVLLTALEAQQREVAPVEAILDQYRASSSRVAVERIDLRQKTFEEREKLFKELDLHVRGNNAGELIGIVVQVGRMTEEGWVPDKSKHIPLQEMWDQSFTEERKPSFNGEQKISSAIREVLDDTRAKLYFLTGHLEQSIDDPAQQEGLAKLAGLLRQRNLEVASLNLLAETKVPDDAALLVIAGPRTKLDEREVQAIERWLQKGGDALVMLEPVFDRRGGTTRIVESGLETLLRDEYGLEAVGQQLFFMYTSELGERKPLDQITCDGFDPAHKAVKPLRDLMARVLFMEARPAKTVPVQGATTTELVKTESLTDLTFAVTDPYKGQQRQADIVKGPFTLVSASEREVGEGEAKTRSRVVLVGDAAWVTNPFIEAREVQNLELFIHTASWAMDRAEKNVGKITRPKSYRLEMAPQTLAFWKLFSVLGLPAISIGIGLFAWSIRRR